MLRVIVQNTMGRMQVSVMCSAHGYDFPHCVWSKQRHVGPEDAAGELHMLADAALEALHSWERGEWEFTDDCYPEDSNNPWNRPAG
jgi:hypothetical protein